jgi:arginine decarboxylase
VAFLKSPVGQMFHQFFGENMLRADVCNAVEELGQLLDHTGPVASERNAARIFNADHLFFVTNGTSTSNKIVWHSTWRRATSWWWTATATSRSCTRS